MTYQILDTIVLDRDLPDHGLRKGDLGAVVEGRLVHSSSVTESGNTVELKIASRS